MIVVLDQSGGVVHGPAPWNHAAVLEPFLVAGYDLLDGVLHGPDGLPDRVFPAREPEARIHLGGFTVLPVVEISEAVPEGKIQTGFELVILADCVEMRPVWADLPPPPPPPSLEEVKAARRLEVDGLRDSRLRLGFAFARGGPHVLQTRGEIDRLNWLGVLSASQALVMGGQGGVAITIRTEGDVSLAIPAVELMAILLGALNHQSAVYAAAWAHKDALNAITEESGGREAVQGHDITTGWP